MEIMPGVWNKGLALYLKEKKALVIGDLHLGYEEAMNRSGILIPRTSTKEIMASFEDLIKKNKPETIIFLGDLKHEFGRISDQEWRDILKVIDFSIKNSQKTVILKGNHDTMLDAIAGKRGLEVTTHYAEGDFFLCHGDLLFDSNQEFKSSKTIIIGHEHPAITIRDGARAEKYKCFLVGKYKNKNLIVLPSFNNINQGTDVLQEKLLSPYIKDIHDCKAIIVADKSYDFGKIRKLRKFAN